MNKIRRENEVCFIHISSENVKNRKYRGKVRKLSWLYRERKLKGRIKTNFGERNIFTKFKWLNIKKKGGFPDMLPE